MNYVSKRAENTQTSRRSAFFYRSAREGMQSFLGAASGRDPRGILLPGYIGWSAREGSGVFDPVKSLGLRAAFYGLNEDLSPDLSMVAELAETGEYGVLVVIHYFGRAVTQMAELRRIADAQGMVLVEDLAHAFFTAMVGRVAGNYGDVCVYSLHKMFPVSYGGMATYAEGVPVGHARSTAPDLASEIMSYDWVGIADRRRSNFLGLTERLAELAEIGARFELLWPSLAGGEVPQSLPVYVVGDKRDRIYESMNRQGIGAVSLYHTLIDEVRGTLAPLHDLSRHVFNLPCHQDVSENSLDGIVETFRRALWEG